VYLAGQEEGSEADKRGKRKTWDCPGTQSPLDRGFKRALSFFLYGKGKETKGKEYGPERKARRKGIEGAGDIRTARFGKKSTREMKALWGGISITGWPRTSLSGR